MQTQINELTLLKGKAFDERYIDFQILNLDISVSMFEKSSR